MIKNPMFYVKSTSNVNKDWTHKDTDKDKDLKLVLKESLRTRTRINITASR